MTIRRSPWWHRRVLVVGDDHPWTGAALAISEVVGASAELVSWAEAAEVEGPVAALFVLAPTSRVLNVEVETSLSRWADRAWQPCALVARAQVRGAARLDSLLNTYCYGATFALNQPPALEGELTERLSRILERGAWLVSRFIGLNGGAATPLLVRFLSFAVLEYDALRTVRSWAQRGSLTYWELDGWFRQLGLLRPKLVLDSLRISTAIVHAHTSGCVLTRNRMAARLGYASGDYLGRRLKELTGLTAKRVFDLPALEAVDVLLTAGAEAGTRHLHSSG